MTTSDDIRKKHADYLFPAVANFYENLSQAGLFDGVELGRTYEVKEGVAFSIKCAFAMAPAAADESLEG